MSKTLILRLHRWTTLVFALPLLVLVVTGLILSFEPIVAMSGARYAAIDATRLTALLAQQDPAGRARGIVLRPYADELAIAGLDKTPRIVSLSTGAIRDGVDPFVGLFNISRSVHEHLVLGLDWLVAPSTLAMLALIILGLLMGFPRLRNTVGGWHKATGWFLLPLIVASPLTGLMLAWNITFSAPPAAGTGAPTPSIGEAVRVVAAEHDLANLIWIRNRGPNLLARVVEDGEFRVYAVGRDGLRAQPRAWPRLIHEGVWRGTISAVINIITSIALLGLLGTGVFMWARRRLRRYGRRPALPHPA